MGLLLLASCGSAAPQTEAQLCLVGHVSSSEWTRTTDVIEEVASRFGLSRNTTYHFVTVWDKRDDLGWQVELIADYSEGRRSIIALFVYDQNLSDVAIALEAAILAEVEASPWISCAQEVGVSVPRTNRPLRPPPD
jgi:hypothetical protein